MYVRPAAQQGVQPITTARVALLLTAASICYLLSTSTSNTRDPAHQDKAHKGDHPAGSSGLQELLGCWQAPGFAASPQSLDLSVMQEKLQFKHYYVAASTIPGAGLGVFARHDMPKGFIWNVEDALPRSTTNFSRSQWDSLSKLVAAFEAAGVQHHALFDFVTLIRRYAYHCKEADLMMVSLTGATLTNHAARPTGLQRLGAGNGGGVAIAGRRARHLLQLREAHAPINKLAVGKTVDVPARIYVPNSVGAWPQDAAAAARLAAALGVQAPSLTERCVLSRTLRPIKAGEELFEDYQTYDCPWPGCNSPTVEAVNKGAAKQAAAQQSVVHKND